MHAVTHDYRISILGAFITLAACFGLWWYMRAGQIELAEQLQSSITERIAITEQYTQEKASLEQAIASLTSSLEEVREERDELHEQLEQEQSNFRALEKRVGSALKTVGELDKLAKTDAELLQKYSKVFFLNEHYAPPRTLPIPKEFLFDESDPQYLHHQVLPFLEDMMRDAHDDEVDLRVVSAFRSFEEQTVLKSAYTVTYGSGANSFSADQGYSEHQLGTTVDLSLPTLGSELTGFETTEAYTWLTEHAHRYGFVLSYPNANGYYIFEPWHWRFVGEDLARYLHRKGLNFYDLDQRTIDTYLVSLFD